ncbi:MAG: 2-hydroxyacyl-CoA dehydratase [Chloroflexi bacterium]|nr:2-hydroxyacyl-CoA dehydratase [Chloroflexota bacterium]
MNYFETEIAKYERRLERIAQNPSPSMLSSNKLLYQALLQHCKEQLKWWREGKPFLTASGGGMAILTRVFGEFRPLGLVPMADRLGTKNAEAAFNRVRTMELPDYACDRTVLLLPMAVEGVDLPKLSLIMTRTGSCNVINNAHRTLSNMMNLPVYMVDVPFEDPHQDHLDYVTQQLERLVEFVEASLPGAKYDEARLVELQGLDHRAMAALHEIHQMRRSVPCPDHPRDVFREPVQPADFVNPSLITEYYESYRDELRQRIQRGFVPVGEEKLRIVWAISGPYGSGVWDYLAERGVSVPYWHYGGGDRLFDMPIYGDESEFGKKLSPLEEVARTILYNSWGGDGERWVRDTISACKEFQADGLVLFEQTGCQPVLGLGQMVLNRLEKEVGIPGWCVEGRMLLGRTERVEDQFMSGLEAFINLCFERKKSR